MLTRTLSLFVLAGLASACQPAVLEDPASLKTGKQDALGADDRDADIWSKVKIPDQMMFFSQVKDVTYTGKPRWNGFKFYGPAGFLFDVTVSSTNGDAVAWVYDQDKRRIGHNDDASDETLDAHIAGALRSNAYHYVVFRDYWNEAATFTVHLTGQYPKADTSCERDTDCGRVQAVCCAASTPMWTAVHKGQEQVYTDWLECNGRVCSPSVTNEDQPFCNAQKQCEMP